MNANPAGAYLIEHGVPNMRAAFTALDSGTATADQQKLIAGYMNSLSASLEEVNRQLAATQRNLASL